MVDCFLPRVRAAVLLGLLLASPAGLPGVLHVAHLPASPRPAAAVLGAAPAAAGHGAACAICHVLSGLRWHAAVPPAALTPVAAGRTCVFSSPHDSLRCWLAEASAGRAPPLRS